MYYLHTADGQRGPYDISQLEAMTAAREIPASTLCWTEGWVEWRPVSEVVAGPAEPRVPRRAPALPPVSRGGNVSTHGAVDAGRVARAGLDELLCCRCGLDFTGAPKKTFFIRARKFICDGCGHANTYPPSKRAMGLYAAILILTFLTAFSLLSQGKVPMPGLLTIVAATSLVEGFFIRRRVKKSRDFFRTKTLGQQ